MGFEVVIAISIVILLFSVIAHEVAHGFVALRFGDRTAEHAGRLTLNPLPHIDLIGTILLPILLFISGLPLFGWAKPVPVNPLNFNDYRRGELMVSLAGIATNFALAIVFALGYHLATNLAPDSVLPLIFSQGVTLNLMLAIFNLLPIPPLDGSQALIATLPYHLARQFQQIERYGFIILMVVLFFPPTRIVVFGIIRTVVGFFLSLFGMS